jgi:hypothetical protein
MTARNMDLMLEAVRRHCLNSETNRHRSLGEKWLGLGSKSEYQTALTAGLMQWVHTPSRGCQGWLRLTPLGENVFLKLVACGITAADFNGFYFQSWHKLGEWRKW